ncbi:YlxR family protein [uncultured Corynebacterium sp.]|uniref:YlxR family protein n=1 Tax=uncultured Corynebacterium sp. TaxID=159447 RepID=UPI0025FF46BB|nr:YlxR family protein [uncultured Corynebacterium sp.]
MTKTRDDHAPNFVERERTCIATRSRRPEGRLLRMVARRDGDATRVVPDPRRRMPGRGAWITPTLDAWEVAQKRRAFGRALKVSAHADANPVREYLEHIEGHAATAPCGDGDRETTNGKT